MDDDVDAVIGELDWPSAENCDLGDIFGPDHGVENRGAHQAGGACQDEMHSADVLVGLDDGGIIDRLMIQRWAAVLHGWGNSGRLAHLNAVKTPALPGVSGTGLVIPSQEMMQLRPAGSQPGHHCVARSELLCMEQIPCVSVDTEPRIG